MNPYEKPENLSPATVERDKIRLWLIVLYAKSTRAASGIVLKTNCTVMSCMGIDTSVWRQIKTSEVEARLSQKAALLYTS